jgi:predicted DNA-binding transcriptional regulator AlpA
MSVQDEPGYRGGLPGLLTAAEVLQILAISRKTLWRLVRSGQLPVVYLDRRPRYLAEDVAALICSRRAKWRDSEVSPGAIYENERDQEGASDE